MSGSRPKTSVAPGTANSPTAARTAWTWCKRSPARITGAPRPPRAAAGSSGHGLTWRRGSEAEHHRPRRRPRQTRHEEHPRDHIHPGRCRPDSPVCDGRGTRDVSDVSRRQAASVHVPARLTSVDLMQPIAAWAQDLARTLLADSLPRRWAHVQGVAARARTSTSSRCRCRPPRGRRVAARHRLPPRTCRHRPARPGRRPLPARRPARRTPSVPPGRTPFLRRHRGRRTRPRPPPDPRVRPAAAAAGQRADLLRHDHQPRRRAGPRAQPPGQIHDRYGSGHLVSRSIRRATPLIVEAVGQVNARAASTR